MNWSVLRDDGALVLATAEEVARGLDMKMADFRDTHALWYSPLSAWIGLSRRGVFLGTGQPSLVSGLWYVRRDEVLCARHRDLEPDVESVLLKKIG